MPKAMHIRQAYLQIEGAAVRIRIIDGLRAILEIKASEDFESSPMPIPLDQALWLIEKERKGSVIEKNRHRFRGPEGLHWDVDVYLGDNKPLIVGEIETPTKGFKLDRKSFQPWVGEEITDDKRLKNKALAILPFGLWKSKDSEAVRRIMHCA